MGQLIGFSKDNLSQVGWIHNIKTQWILPKYHIVYDETFETAPRNERWWNIDVHANDNLWADIFEKGRDRYIDDEVNEKGLTLNITELHKEWLLMEEPGEQKEQLKGRENR